jgi:hypothetical protein
LWKALTARRPGVIAVGRMEGKVVAMGGNVGVIRSVYEDTVKIESFPFGKTFKLPLDCLEPNGILRLLLTGCDYSVKHGETFISRRILEKKESAGRGI